MIPHTQVISLLRAQSCCRGETVTGVSEVDPYLTVLQMNESEMYDVIHQDRNGWNRAFTTGGRSLSKIIFCFRAATTSAKEKLQTSPEVSAFLQLHPKVFWVMALFHHFLSVRLVKRHCCALESTSRWRTCSPWRPGGFWLRLPASSSLRFAVFWLS